ncbi:hypothetical protein ACIHAR_27490 [Streptomyces sp. NPDC052016]|uniref:hypothetical protein n=1 Tax=Streptomyces sp. NPDC052016 TaxID=3365680 RepID=UPI0037CED9BD
MLFAFCVLATATLLAAELYMVCARAQAQRRLLDMRTWMEWRSTKSRRSWSAAW